MRIIMSRKEGKRVATGLATAVLTIALVVHAAEISNVQISNVNPDAATVTWTTDQNTDATINFGLDERVGTVRDSSFDKKDHTLTIDNLDPATTYHFRVVSTDKD